MTVHAIQSPDTSPLIQAVHDAQARALNALERVRSAAWDAGLKGNTSHAEEDFEDGIAHECTAAVADLVKLALGVAEVAS